MTDYTIDEDGHCNNPNCTRNHKAEMLIADAVEQIAEQLARMTGCEPVDAIHGLGQALAHHSFKHSLPGRERAALDDMLEMVQFFGEQLLQDEDAMKAKKERDALMMAEMGEADAPEAPRPAHLH